MKKTNTSTAAGKRRLVVCIQPKGSAGKTTFLAALTDYYLQHPSKPKIAAFDPDCEMRTYARIFGPEGSAPLPKPHFFQCIDWRSDDGNIVLDSVCRSLLGDNAADVALVDGVANQQRDVFTWAQSIKLYDNAERFGFDLTFVIPVDGTDDTATGAIAAVKEIGSRADVVIVRNEKDGHHLPWDKAYAAANVEIPRLYQLRFEALTPDMVRMMQGTSTGRPHSLNALVHQTIDPFTGLRALSIWERLLGEFERLSDQLLPGNVLASAK